MSVPSLEGFARHRAASVLWSKLVDALVVVILIRALPRADYGIVGLAAGWLAAMAFLNLAPENILWRDFRKLQPALPRVLGACVAFWALKTGVVLLLASGIAVAQFNLYREPMVPLYLMLATLFSALTTLSFIFELPLAVAFHYRRVARLTMLLRGLWLAMVLTLFLQPSLQWFAIVSALYYVVHLLVWIAVARHEHAFVWPAARELRQIIVDAVRDFVLWQHLAAAARAFMQRGDLALIGFMGFALGDMGNYLIGLNVATFALILPGVFEMTTTAGLAHSTEPASDRRILRQASVWNFVVVAAQLVVFQMFAQPLLGLLFGMRRLEACSTLEFAGPLVLGSSVLALLLPRLAHAMVRGVAVALWWRVYLPGAALGAVCFAVGAWQWGLRGVAWAHVVNALILAVALQLLRRPKQIP